MDSQFPCGPTVVYLKESDLMFDPTRKVLNQLLVVYARGQRRLSIIILYGKSPQSPKKPDPCHARANEMSQI